MKPIRKHVLMEATVGDTGGTTTVATTTATTGTTATAAATTTGATTDDKAGGTTATTATTDKTTAAEAWTMPDKFKVTKEDGSVDLEASAKKMGESLTHLEKRMGSGDVPPKAAEEYKVNIPDEWKEAFPDSSETMAAFRKDALAQGLTQKQFDFFIGKYIEEAPKLITGAAQLNKEEAMADLRKSWPTEAEYTTQSANAAKAMTAFLDPKDADKAESLTSNPVLVRLLARIGSEMKEGGGIPAAADGASTDDIQALMMSEAANNPKHADHKATRAKINAHYEKKYGTAPVT